MVRLRGHQIVGSFLIVSAGLALWQAYSIGGSIEWWREAAALVGDTAGKTRGSWAALRALVTSAAMLCVGIGLWRAKRWARLIGIMLAACVLPALAVSVYFLGGRVLTVVSVAGLAGWLITFMYLWRSRGAIQAFGSQRAVSVIAWIGIGSWVLVAIGIGGIERYLRQRGPDVVISRHLKQQAGQPLPAGMVYREVCSMRIAFPADARVQFVTVNEETNWSSAAVVLAEDAGMVIVTCDSAEGTLYSSAFRPLGINDAYDAHRYVLTSGSAMARIFRGIVSDASQSYSELTAPGWRGYGTPHSRADSPKQALDFSLYERSASGSGEMMWVTNDRRWSRERIEDAVILTTFTVERSPQHYLAEGKAARAAGRLLDAQFALAQAYLLGARDVKMMLALAEVSAGLGSWRLTKKLSSTVLSQDPDHVQAQALQAQAVSAIEQ